MRNKSLVFRSCGPNTLCGISVRFQTLSPTQGQVAHALLTRPPLTYSEQAPCKSVRLECVMHAASVNPEPGSNSRNHSILSDRRRSVKINFELVSALSLPFLELYSLSELSRCSSHILCFILISYCSIFKDRSPPFSRQLDYYITFNCICQHFFETFFDFFLSF